MYWPISDAVSPCSHTRTIQRGYRRPIFRSALFGRLSAMRSAVTHSLRLGRDRCELVGLAIRDLCSSATSTSWGPAVTPSGADGRDHLPWQQGDLVIWPGAPAGAGFKARDRRRLRSATQGASGVPEQTACPVNGHRNGATGMRSSRHASDSPGPAEGRRVAIVATCESAGHEQQSWSSRRPHGSISPTATNFTAAGPAGRGNASTVLVPGRL